MNDFKVTPFAERLLNQYYLLQNETPEEGFYRAAHAYCFGDYHLASRIYGYAQKGWFMFSSPVLSNAPSNMKWDAEGSFHTNVSLAKSMANTHDRRPLPISCFLTYAPDSIEGIIDHEAEVKWMSISGGGVGAHWGDIRSIGATTSRGAKSPGIIPFMHCLDSAMLAYHQGGTRRGNTACYLGVGHPELLDFLGMRVPSGDSYRRNRVLHHGVNITHEFVQAVQDGAEWSFKDPHSGAVTDTIEARVLWEKLLETRFRTGEPYLNFIDDAYESMHPALKAKGLKLHGSNLCNEIHLPTAEGRSAVCCLSSLNLERYDEWKDTRIVEDCITFLDNVLEYFVLMAPKYLTAAVYSASSERSLGLGCMGFHSLLQRRGIPFESAMASSINREVHSTIKQRALQQSELLARERGEPADLKGYGVRNAHLLAIAPNSNSSIICDTSPSIEPWKANAFEMSTRAGSQLYKNQYLKKILAEHDMDTDGVWQQILTDQGSVQNLDLPEHIKDTFKTAAEIDQHWVVEHAGVRQQWVCQGQSLNLFFPAGSDINYVSSVHMKAAKGPVKGLYYLRTDGKPVEDISKQIELVRPDDEDCIACEG